MNTGTKRRRHGGAVAEQANEEAHRETDRNSQAQEAAATVPLHGGVVAFSAHVLKKPLRPYQAAAAQAIQQSILAVDGLTFTVMMARQMGKNELSAHLEAWLLDHSAQAGGTIVMAAPTFRPQILNSMLRLQELLRHPHFQGRWRREHGYMLALDEARIAFYSAEPQANVVGATASLLLEIDEAQGVDPDKFTRDFRPMAAATNATTVLYGTAWSEDSLLEQQRRRNLELQAQGLAQRHFEFDWEVGARENEAYQKFVMGEIERLGREHPLIRTQYLLQCQQGGGTFFTPGQRLLLRGTHPRRLAPATLADGVRYVAAVDVAGAAEEPADAALRALAPRKDSTVAGLAEVTPRGDGGPPLTRIVEIYWWTGRPLHEQCDRLIHLLRDVWRCAKVVVDASGLGADLAGRLERALGSTAVEPFIFSVQSKSRLAFHLLAHVDNACLQMWAEPDGARSPEADEFWNEVERVKPRLRTGDQLGFYVPEAQGHDDFVMMLALLAWAARDVRPAPARAIVRPKRWYEGEGRY
ncbi:MAG: hypothetical protein HY332_00630 [Chloroflexi bacterium]|nr:hypothetical protein [Chloroflexota bacterium]